MIKYLKYIFISFLCILLMSHNTSALDLTVGVTNIWTGARPATVVWWSNDGYTSNTFICGGGTDYRTKVRVLEVTFGGGVANYIQKGDIFVLELSATSDNNANVNIDFARELVDTTGNFEILDIQYSTMGHSAGGINIYMVATRNNVHSASIERSNSAEWFSLNNTSGVECMNAGNWTVYRPTGNGSQAIVDAINNSSDASSINDAKDAIIGAINEQKQAEENYYNEQEEAVDNINNQSPDDIDSGDSSGATSLLGAMGSLFTTIKDTAATNCLITGDLGHVDMGQLNLCQGKEHFQSLFNFIGYSCLFVVVFWASYSLVKRILRLIDWYRSK